MLFINQGEPGGSKGNGIGAMALSILGFSCFVFLLLFSLSYREYAARREVKGKTAEESLEVWLSIDFGEGSL